MMIANTGNLAMRFNETGVSTSGSLTKGIRKPPPISFAREKAVNDILNLAKTRNQPVGIIIMKVLSQSIPELQSFVQARGEVPNENLAKLAVQAAMLRATEIGLVAKTLDTDDNDALYTIEESEQEHVEDNSGENTSILSPEAAGALWLMVDRISKRHKKKGRSGNLKDFIFETRRATRTDNFGGMSCGKFANNAVGDEYLAEFDQNYGTNLAGGGGSGGGSFWDNLFNNIDKIVDGVVKTTGAINTTVGNAQTAYGGILGQATDIGGTIGKKSIEQYLQDNGFKILIIVVLLILFTIIISRAIKRN